MMNMDGNPSRISRRILLNQLPLHVHIAHICWPLRMLMTDWPTDPKTWSVMPEAKEKGTWNGIEFPPPPSGRFSDQLVMVDSSHSTHSPVEQPPSTRTFVVNKSTWPKDLLLVQLWTTFCRKCTEWEIINRAIIDWKSMFRKQLTYG